MESLKIQPFKEKDYKLVFVPQITTLTQSSLYIKETNGWLYTYFLKRCHMYIWVPLMCVCMRWCEWRVQSSKRFLLREGGNQRTSTTTLDQESAYQLMMTMPEPEGNTRKTLSGAKTKGNLHILWRNNPFFLFLLIKERGVARRVLSFPT